MKRFYSLLVFALAFIAVKASVLKEPEPKMCVLDYEEAAAVQPRDFSFTVAELVEMPVIDVVLPVVCNIASLDDVAIIYPDNTVKPPLIGAYASNYKSFYKNPDIDPKLALLKLDKLLLFGKDKTSGVGNC